MSSLGYNQRPVVWVWLLGFLIVLQFHCDRKNPTVSHPRDRVGTIVLHVAIPAGQQVDPSAKVVITRGQVRVSGEGMVPFDTTLVVQEGWIDGRLRGIPVGKRTVVLTLEEGSGEAVWEGSTQVEVQEGQVAEATLELQRVNDQPPVISQITIQPTPGWVDSLFTFQVQVEDRHDPTDSLRVRWDFDNDGAFEVAWTYAKEASHTYSRTGNYTIILETRDRSGHISRQTQAIQVVDIRAVLPDSLRTSLRGLIELNGSASIGIPGQPLIYHWSQVVDYEGAQSSVLGTLTDNHTESAGRVSFEPKVGSGLYVFTLQVETAGHQSTPDTLLVWVSSTPPVASVSPPEAVEAGQSLILQGQATDADGDALSYRWRGEHVEMLSDTTRLTPTFTATAPGEYRFSLVVIDTDPQESEPAEVVVTVVSRNEPPVADAGEGVNLVVGDVVQLDGRGSRDPEEKPLSYTWAQKEGPSVALQGSDTATPNFTPAEAGRYVFSLVVSDGDKESPPDEVVIVVQPNRPPVADAGADQVIQVGENGVLDGRGSQDAEGVELIYRWIAPTGISLSSTTAVQLPFTADVAGVYQIILVVNDGYQNSVPDTVSIRVNTPPVADAGVDQEVTTGAVVQLNGSGSRDADGDGVSYRWTAPAGIVLSDGTLARPTFEAKAAGMFRFSLVVDDGYVESAPDEVEIAVAQVNRVPVAYAGADQSVEVGARVQLDGSGGRDPDGHELSFVWKEDTGNPATGLLSDATSDRPTFTPTAAGAYRFSLTVNDGQTDSAPDTVEIVVIQPNRVPVADAGPDQAVEVGTTVQLDGSSSTDADGDALTYQWSAPTGIVLKSTAVARPTFTASAVGGYRFTLVVNDGAVDSVPDEVVVVVNLPVVRFADPNLEAAVREAIGKPEGDMLPADVAGLKSLNAREWAIAKLDGIGQLTSLEELFLDSNHLSDISALSALTSLVILEIANSQVSDISALSPLTSLKHLYLPNNQIRDISVLTTHTSLVTLELNRNPIRDFSALSALTSLQKLHLMDNRIRDLSALSGLTLLSDLRLGGNQISDISFLVDNSGIDSGDKVDLRENPLSEEAISTQIPALRARGVEVLFDEPVVSEPVVTEEITVDLPGGATMEFVWIEPGRFMMGSPSTEPGRQSSEGPQHEVMLTKGFWLGKYEVTQRQWEAVMETQPWSDQIHVQPNPNHPAVYISWNEVQGLIAKLNAAANKNIYRLPTEAEWEYACRAGTVTRWSFGDDESRLKEYAWYRENAWNVGERYAHQVGMKKPNPWGLYDVHGNVDEWCQDWYGSYSSSAQTNPIGPASGSSRVLRSGNFDFYAQHARSAYRYFDAPDYRHYYIGARLLRMESSISVNTPPEANAGVDQHVEVGGEVPLDGSGSSDADEDALSYTWTEDIGNPVLDLLLDDSVERPMFTPTVAGVYQFSLTVSDGQVESAPDTVEVTVVQPNHPPVTDAGGDQSAVEGATVQLDGSGSSDVDGEDVLTYQWTQIAGPVVVRLSDETVVQPTFTAHVSGEYTFGLVVSDEAAESDRDEVVITVTVPQPPGRELTVELPGDATMEFMWIEPGTFTMGSLDMELGRWDDEGPQHDVTLSRGFYLGKCELTQRQWESVMGTTPWLGQSYVQSNPDHPAVYIMWNDVQAFIHRLNEVAGDSLYRLPTEAEWEYACRAGTTTRWSFGDDESRLGEYAWYEANAGYVGEQYAHAVGTKLPNLWGLYDMHGNVWEWCQDWYGSYSSSAQTDPTGPTSGFYRVKRGGDFGHSAWSTRSACRNYYVPSDRYYYFGVRLLRVAEPIPLNRAPVAHAGPDQAVAVGTMVQLDGSGSWDADEDALSYAWTEDIGNPVPDLLSGDSAERPMFTPTAAGVYQFSLTVSDGQVESAPDTVEVTVVQPNHPPVADAGGDQSVVEGATVQLDGSGSSDADEDELTFRWEQVTGPVTVNFSNAFAMDPTFTASQMGTYRFSLVVSDGQVDSAPDEVIVTVITPIPSTPELTVDLPGSVTMEFVWIEPGTFMMGSPDIESGRSSNEGPQHEVTLSQGFWLGKYEITQEQWESVMGTQPWSGQDYVQANPNHPAVYISWNEVQTFIHALNEAVGDSLYRLPTEAEWEYACRAGTTTRWSVGDDESRLGEYAWYVENTWDVGLEYAQPVGQKLPNPWGLYDMHGNVWEWCQDWYDRYSSSAQTDPTGPALGTRRISRGGDFGNTYHGVRSALRNSNPPDGSRSYAIGTRVVRMMEPAVKNTQPEADAGMAQRVEVGVPVVLDGSGSWDADGDELSYAWVEGSDNPATGLLSDVSTERPIFMASVAGVYHFMLTVSDGQVESAPDEVVVMITVPQPPGQELMVGLPGGATMEFVWIEPGTFMMGSPDTDEMAYDWEKPQHEVTLSRGFYLGKYEVTQGQWESVMGTTPWSGQSFVRSNSTHPAVYISWNDVQGFIQKLNQAAGAEVYRLPTEAEWEYACRTGTTTRWSFGDGESQLEFYAWYDDNTCGVGECYAHAVGTKLPNPWGLYDMHGNVDEWCQDWWGNYSSSAQTDPTGPASGPGRVLRGGSFTLYAQSARSAPRGGIDPSNSTLSRGARLLRMAESIPLNRAPVAHAGPDQTVAVGTMVQLDGSGSWDADEDALSYAWTEDIGNPVPDLLSGDSAERPMFTPTAAGVYQFSLTVSDGQVESAPDTVEVTVVQPNHPPVADAGRDQSVVEGATVQLDGSGSSDVDGEDVLTYQWTQIAGPVVVRLSDETVVQPTFTAHVSGEYTFGLVVSDEAAESDRDEVVITVTVPQPPGRELTVELPGDATMEFVWIEPGTFMMGSPDSDVLAYDEEKPQHLVTISRGFWLGKYELTQGQWEAVMGTTPWSVGPYVQANSSNPAVDISWKDVQGFIQKLNQSAGAEVYRLPTEAEWEYACRAGTTTRWSFGDDASQLGEYAWYYHNAWNVGEQYAHAVGTKKPNPWGLYDMHGNVWEWCQDWYGGYSSHAQTDLTGPTSGSDRVARGGLFAADARYTRSAYRHSSAPSVRDYYIGVRLLRTK